MFTPSQLAGYLDRIGHSGPSSVDLATLRAVHAAHVRAIPYENLDIQLGRGISLDREDLYAKLVTARRGGFCYEQNGVMACALRAIGFDVTLMAGAVDREVNGDSQWLNHMPLLVHLPEGDFAADAGLGDGFAEPLPLAEGVYEQGCFTHRMERLHGEDEGVWRCTPDPYGSVRSFDFRTEPRDPADFAAPCEWRATSPESSFVKTLVVGHPRERELVVLRGATVSFTGPDEPFRKRYEFVEDAAGFAAALGREFGVVLPPEDVEALWAKAYAQHEAWKAEMAAADAKTAEANRGGDA